MKKEMTSFRKVSSMLTSTSRPTNMIYILESHTLIVYLYIHNYISGNMISKVQAKRRTLEVQREGLEEGDILVEVGADIGNL